VLFFTPWPAEYLRAKILAQASALTGAEMSIGSLELRFFPPRLILRDVHLARKDPTGEELRVACDEADVSLPYGVYHGKLDRIDALRLSSPQVFLKRAPRGPTAPAQPPVGPPTTALIPVGVGRLDVSEGELHVVDPHADWEAALARGNPHRCERGGEPARGTTGKMPRHLPVGRASPGGRGFLRLQCRPAQPAADGGRSCDSRSARGFRRFRTRFLGGGTATSGFGPGA